MNDPPAAINQYVAIVPILNLQDVTDYRISGQTLNEILLRLFVVLLENFFVNLNQGFASWVLLL